MRLKLKDIKPGVIIWVSNPVSYLKPVEEGTDKRAGLHFISAAMNKFEAFYGGGT